MIRTLSAILLIPFFHFIIDISMRYDYLTSLRPRYMRNYISSVLFEVLFFMLLAYVLRRYRAKKRVMVIALVLAVVQVLAYGHVLYFNVLPNFFSMSYLVENFANTWVLMKDTLSWWYLVGVLLLAALYAWMIFFAMKHLPQLGFKKKVTLIAVTIIAMLVLNNNVRFHPNTYTSAVSSLVSSKYLADVYLLGLNKEMRKVYPERKFSITDTFTTEAKYNVIVFLSESLQAKHMGYFGYERNTTPYISSLVEKGDVIPFSQYYTNINSTALSVPLIFSGSYTDEPENVPYIYDYVSAHTGAEAFFYSAHALQNANMTNRLQSPNLKPFIYKENSGLREHNNLGADDFDVFPMVEKRIAELKGKPFFGVVHLLNTHYPYRPYPQYQKFMPSELKSMNAYDNTIVEQDAMLKQYIEMLAKQGVLEKTVIFFLSDHGEAFGEHGHNGHLQSMYNEEMHIPLWIYLPPSFPKEQRDALSANRDRVAGHIDITPTILDIYGLSGKIQVQQKHIGQSLFAPLPEDRVIPVTGAGMVKIQGLVMGSRKFVMNYNSAGDQYQLYDMAKDPAEKVNIWNTLTPEEQEGIKSTFANVQTIKPGGN